MLGEMSNDRVSLETELNFLKNYVELAQLLTLVPILSLMLSVESTMIK